MAAPIVISPRQNTTQQVNYERKNVPFNFAAGPLMIGSIPVGSVITGVALSVSQAFNAGTTNPITLGVTPAGAELMAAGDNTPGTVGFYPATRGLGTQLTTAPQPATSYGDPEGGVSLYLTYAPTGTAPTAGMGVVSLTFIPPTDS